MKSFLLDQVSVRALGFAAAMLALVNAGLNRRAKISIVFDPFKSQGALPAELAPLGAATFQGRYSFLQVVKARRRLSKAFPVFPIFEGF